MKLCIFFLLAVIALSIQKSNEADHFLSMISHKNTYAIDSGAKVTWSASFDSAHENYQLDNTQLRAGWSAKYNSVGQWIQVETTTPKYWTGIVIQGRGDTDQRVTSYRVLYSVDGDIWEYTDNGKIYPAAMDRSTKIENDFDNIVEAKYLRIYPQTWLNHMSLRFDAIYLS